MKAEIIKALRNKWLGEAKEYIDKMEVQPQVVIIRANDYNHATTIYLKNKIATMESIGIKAIEFYFHEDEMEAAKELIECFNCNINVLGIIVQLPYWDGQAEELINLISPEKDIDGLGFINQSLLYTDKVPYHIPATALACYQMIKEDVGWFDGLDVTVIGRSYLVGRPLAKLLEKKGATVAVAHSKTDILTLRQLCKHSEVIVSCVGKPNLIDSKYTKDAMLVVDVGINRGDNNKLCGDLEESWNKTPVPGGIGLLTTAMLCKAIIKSDMYKRENDKNNFETKGFTLNNYCYL